MQHGKDKGTGQGKRKGFVKSGGVMWRKSLNWPKWRFWHQKPGMNFERMGVLNTTFFSKCGMLIIDNLTRRLRTMRMNMRADMRNRLVHYFINLFQIPLENRLDSMEFQSTSLIENGGLKDNLGRRLWRLQKENEDKAPSLDQFKMAI